MDGLTPKARSAERFALCDGIELTIDSDTRQGFEMFLLRPGPGQELDQFLNAAQGRRRLLDIGALHGFFSLAFTAREGAAALAVEPSPLALPGLRTNCLLNPRHDIRIIDGAAGAAEAVIRMRHDGLHLIGADLIPHGPEPAMVKVVPGDALVADQRFPPDMIKIDVEGYEQQVLEGLLCTLDYFKPNLHIEMHGPWLPMFGGSVDGVCALLQRRGYRMQMIDGRDPFAVGIEALRSQMFHLLCTHTSTAWANRVRGI